MSTKLSKAYKLPKKFWVKGKSKFLYPRLVEEGIDFGNHGWMGEMYYTPIERLYDKLEGRTRTLKDILKSKGVKPSLFKKVVAKITGQKT